MFKTCSACINLLCVRWPLLCRISFANGKIKEEHELHHEAQPSGVRPDKTRAASFLNGFKNIPGKACVKRVHNNDAFVNVGN